MDWRSIWVNLVAQAIWLAVIALGVVIFAVLRSLDPFLVVLSGLLAVALALVIWREGEDRLRRWRRGPALPSVGAFPKAASPPAVVHRARDFGARFRPALWFEPLRRVVTAEDGSEGVLAVVKVSNPRDKPQPVTNCTARLVAVFKRVPALNEAGDVELVEQRLELAAVYLKWSEQDGGGRTCTFQNDGCFEVAHIGHVSDKFAQLQTVNTSLRDQYRVELSEAHTFVIEVCDDLGRRAEHGFELQRNPLSGFLGERLTPLQSVKFKVSDLWLAKALQRVASIDQAAAGSGSGAYTS